MSKKTIWLWPLLILTLTCLALPAIAQRDAEFSDTTTVTVVEVPITVSNDGQPIRGLTKDNFEIIDGRQEQEIIGFEVVDLGEREERDLDVPVAARRHFLAFFDLSFSDPNSIRKAQEAATDLVLSHLHPSDLTAVATYSKSQGPKLVLPFTTDRVQVRYAIESLGLVSNERTQRDPLGLITRDLEPSANPDAGGAAGFGAELQEQLAELQRFADRNNKAEQISTVAQSMDALAQISLMLNAVEGRKHVLYLSEGFDGELLFGTEDISEMMRISRSVELGRTQDVNNDDRFGNSDARRVVDRTLDILRRSDASIQAIDIGGLVAGGRNRNLDSLRYMAGETDGDMYANFNDLGDAMEQMLEKTSVTYLVSFSPKDLEPNGEFRELKVKTNGVPRGADVSHRPGYFAPRPYSEQNPFERQLKVAHDLVGGQRGGGVAVNALAAGFAVAGEPSYVPVLVEASGADLRRGHSDSRVPIEIYAYALDDEGAIRDYFVRSLAIDAEQAGPAFQSMGVKYWGHFDLAPGEYTVRVLARNPMTGVSGVDVDTVHVAGAEDSDPTLSVLFPEEPSKWVLVREEASEQRDVEFPFLAKGQPFIPSALPSASGTTPLYLVAHDLGAGSLSAEGLVLTREGETVKGGTLSLASDAEAGEGASTLAATFDTKGVKPGEYLLVATLKNLANGREARASLPIRVQ